MAETLLRPAVFNGSHDVGVSLAQPLQEKDIVAGISEDQTVEDIKIAGEEYTGRQSEEGKESLEGSQAAETPEHQAALCPEYQDCRIDHEYIQKLEQRLSALEAKMKDEANDKKLESHLIPALFEEPYKKTEDADTSKSREHRKPLSIPEVRRVNFADFKNRYSDDAGRYAVEVLIAGPNLKDEIANEELARKHKSRKDPREAAKEVISQANQASEEEQWVHRIRINSAHILTIMGRVSGLNMSPTPRTFYKPFEMPIHYHEKMKEAFEELEVKRDKAENTQLSDTQANKLSAEGPEQEGIVGISVRSNQAGRLEALRDMRCYINFMDSEIIPLTHQFDSPTSEKVRFDDLWYLFKAGDEVYNPSAGEGLGNDLQSSAQSLSHQTVRRVYGIACSSLFESSRLLSRMDEAKRLTAFSGGPKISLFTVRCYIIDYDGKSFGPVCRDFRFHPYEGERSITSLDICPVRFHPNYNNLREKLKYNGKKFQKSIQEKHLSYTGFTLISEPTRKSIENLEGNKIRYPEHIESEVIVDFVEAFQTHTNWKVNHTIPTLAGEDFLSWKDDSIPIKQWFDPNHIKHSVDLTERVAALDPVNRLRQNECVKKDKFLTQCKEMETDQGKRTQSLSDDDCLLLPRRIFAYVLRERKFAELDCRFLSETNQNGGFESLRLPTGYKEMVQALVDSHFTKKRLEKHIDGESLDYDVVQGKGRGLVILLHGVPGVGKTSTAECVARANKKPLFPITCGDLGSTPSDLESSLGEIFRFAHLWDCVLLFDEADVFLTRRVQTDLKRNALVSVFLRALEYYNGILFLTTNRVGVLDEAIKSRIHISLHYPTLGRDDTIEIWKMNLERARSIDKQRTDATTEAPPLEIKTEKLLDYAKKHFDETKIGGGRWNGRQIRNAFQIATSLAHYDARNEYQSQLLDDPNAPPVTPKLRVLHFKKVADATIDFDSYMYEVAGKVDSTLALERGIRADHFRGNFLSPGSVHADERPTPPHHYDFTRPYQQQSQPMGYFQGGGPNYITTPPSNFGHPQAGQPPSDNVYNYRSNLQSQNLSPQHIVDGYGSPSGPKGIRQMQDLQDHNQYSQHYAQNHIPGEQQKLQKEPQVAPQIGIQLQHETPGQWPKRGSMASSTHRIHVFNQGFDLSD